MFLGLSNGKPKCVCCGEKRDWALVIDHIHNGGTAHRRNSNTYSTARLVWADYKKTGVWPIHIYQLLCATCNHGKRLTTSTCPHNKENNMNKKNVIEMVKSYVKVFSATILTLFLADGSDVFAVDFSQIQTYLSAGLASVLPLIITALDPNDLRFGKNSEL